MKSGSFNKHAFLFCAAVLGILLGSGHLSAQSAATVDSILGRDILSFGAASYLVLRSAGDFQEHTGADRAFTEAAARMAALMPRFAETPAEDPVSLGEYCFMLMKIHGHPGGLFYKLFPGPRYAARDLSFEGVLKKRANPYARISGKEALQIVGRYLYLFPRSGDAAGGN